MARRTNWFDQYTMWADHNIKGIQYGVYSVALCGLYIAVRSVRPCLKFKTAADIPKHFVAKKISFRGKVLRIEQTAKDSKHPTLIVDHLPIIHLPVLHTTRALPVVVSGIDVSGHGLSWLQSLIVNSDIVFTPLRCEGDTAHCIVKSKKQNVGTHMVSIGFATVSVLDLKLEQDQTYLKYYKELLSAENKAERSRRGVWANENTGGWFSNLLKRSQNFRFSFV